ncbi:MAG: hypothetical protein AWU59_2490 [Methanolobus sp. T82-4]|jgi:starvation-inducible outer membrane lipoprotein|nr:MAG: hypothetical protein AWU59_2490 [Methanolobus sp. T82-4]
MQSRQYTILVLVITLCIILSGCVTKDSLESEEITRSFNVSSRTVVYVNQISGPVAVSTWEDDTVQMTAQKKAYFGGREELDKVSIAVTEGNRELLIETKYPLYGEASVSVEMQLMVPGDVTVKVLETTEEMST